MTKKDIILKISEDTGFKQVDVKEVVQRTFDIIVDRLG
nr:HU family DNA-binding protein [Candidatus Omnitrophota bacterium]